jgi:DNA polymerase/3'-5' exonuclease PolX
MATPNPQEIQRLLDKLEAAYRRLGETNPFQNFDVNQFRDATTAVRALEDGLRGVEDRLDSVRDDLDYINKSFTDSLNELSKQDVYLKMQRSSLSDISNIARQALSIRWN